MNAECAWKAERQLAPHMTANGSNAASTYVAVDSLLLEVPPIIGVRATPVLHHPQPGRAPANINSPCGC